MSHTNLLTILLCLILATACATTAFAEPTKIPTLPAHPRLLLTSKGIADMKSRIKDCDWAREQWNSIKKEADESLGKDIVMPPRGSNWGHYYACPVHGCSLITGKKIGEWKWEHKCPVGGEILLGDPSKPNLDYDGCIIGVTRKDWTNALMDMGLAYQVTGDARYADKARDILLAFANIYLTYPLHNNHGEPKTGGGRMGSQQLDESVWLIQVCQGADLVWDTLSQSEKDTITTKMLLPAAKEVIAPGALGIHNIQCWRNSAMGLVGFLLGDDDLIHKAIDDPKSGFLAQMSKGVAPDGPWLEGAWGYHFYTMSAVWNLTEAARNCGIDLYCPEYKSMFKAPVRFAMPNMHLPAFNDSGEVNFGSDLYELAYARYKDPICLEPLAKSDRHNNYALWFGEIKLPAPPEAQLKSANYPRTGQAILTKGDGENATWLDIKYGPHGGGHGHYDKLNFVLYARGKTIGVDPGTSKYGVPMHGGWQKTTLAHNTLTVDENSQKAAEGRSIAFGSENGVDYSVCEAGPIYEGVRFTRTIALISKDLVVFIDQISADKEHTLDLAYHQLGEWKNLSEGITWTPPDKPGYSYLRDAASRKTAQGIALNAQVSKKFQVAIGLASGEPTEVITATGIGKNTTDRVPVVIFRRHAKETSLAWFISLNDRPVHIEQLDVLGVNGSKLGAEVMAVSVTATDGKKWNLVANPEKQAVVVSLPGGLEWRTDSVFGVKSLD